MTTRPRNAAPDVPIGHNALGPSGWVRVGFAGPGAVIVAMVTMAGMTQWLPAGAAGIDNLVLPLVLLPIIWAALFFHACLDRKLARVAAVALGLLLIHGGLIAHEFMTHQAVAGATTR